MPDNLGETWGKRLIINWIPHPWGWSPSGGDLTSLGRSFRFEEADSGAAATLTAEARHTVIGLYFNCFLTLGPARPGAELRHFCNPAIGKNAAGKENVNSRVYHSLFRPSPSGAR